MTLDDFRRLAESWGGDTRRWPQKHRQSADVLAQTPDGATILAEAQRLDSRIWSAAPDVTERRASDAMHAVMSRMASGTATPARAGVLFRWPRWLMPSAGFACAAFVGLVAGFAYPLVPADSETVAQIALAAILDNGAIGTEWVLQ